MKNFYYFLSLILLFIISGCSDDMHSNVTEVPDFQIENEIALKKFAALSESWRIFIQKNEENISDLQNIEKYNFREKDVIILKFGKNVNSYYAEIKNKSERSDTKKIKVSCEGDCSNSGTGMSCIEIFDSNNGQIYCGCQDDNCYMTVTTEEE